MPSKESLESQQPSGEIPPPPEKPDPNECCGSGCVPCIYDYYFDRLAAWEAQHGPVHLYQPKKDLAQKMQK